MKLKIEQLEDRTTPVLWNNTNFASDFVPIPGWDRNAPTYEIQGDFDNDGQFDHAYAAGEGGSARVVIWGDLDHDLNTPDWGIKHDAVYFDPNWRGGADLSVATSPGADILVIFPAILGGGPVIQTLTLDGSVNSLFTIYDINYRGGIHITSDYVDINSDGIKDLLISPKIGGGPILSVVDPVTGIHLKTFLFGPETDRNGMGPLVAAAQFDNLINIYINDPQNNVIHAILPL